MKLPARADALLRRALHRTLIARIENYECVIDASLNASFQRNKLQGAA